MMSGNLIDKEISVIPSTGLYKSGNDFIELYKRGEISFGKAVEIALVDIEEMKEILHKKGIVRESGMELNEIEYISEEAVKFALR
jgi:hypothetical protein